MASTKPSKTTSSKTSEATAASVKDAMQFAPKTSTIAATTTSAKATVKATAKAATKATPKTVAPTKPALKEVLAIASEIYPLIKTGGLADVVGALPLALQTCAVHVTTLVPGYPRVMAALHAEPQAKVILSVKGFFGGSAQLWSAHIAGMDLWVLDAPHLFNREGNPYLNTEGQDWGDNPVRFAALSLMGAQLAWGEYPELNYQPDAMHVHDWQTALAPVYLHYLGQGRHRPKTIITIHNLAFQGQFPAGVFQYLGLPAQAFSNNGVEYYGCVGFLKAGILFSDEITTVSPSYAHEITTPNAGMGMDGLLRAQHGRLSGIVNGIDTDVWNPATDASLAQTFDVSDLSKRAVNKRAVEAHFGIAHSDAPLVCIVSRLTWQKGMDLLVNAIDAIVAKNVRVVILGSGDTGLEATLYAKQRQHPTHVAIHTGYDESLSHLMQGGCDAILVPSRFEPCGLTQLYGLRYGCLPVVTSVGGLNDTVIDANFAAVNAGVATGIACHEISVDGIIHAVERMVQLYAQPKIWQAMQTAGMTTDVGWANSAQLYQQLY